MSRPLARRVAVLTAVGSCLAAATVPALAQTVSPDSEPVTVYVEQDPGERLFSVLDDNDAALTDLDFRDVTDGRLPFKTVVTDNALPLSGAGYRVSAVMSNLYYVNPDGTTLSLDDKVASSDLSIGYKNPLSVPVLELPVKPDVLLSGSIQPCTADMLTLASLGDAVLSLLCPLLGLSGVDVPAGTVVTETATQTVTLTDLIAANGGAALDRLGLPFPLTDQQQTGAFTNPARYQVSPYDDQVDGTVATTKRLMTGGPAALDTITGLVDDVLQGKVLDGTLTTLTTGATPSLVPTDALQSTLESAPGLDTIMFHISQLAPADASYLLETVTGTLQTVLEGDLSTLNAQYVANPVLIARPAASKPGLYQGQLTVTFFQE